MTKIARATQKIFSSDPAAVVNQIGSFRNGVVVHVTPPYDATALAAIQALPAYLGGLDACASSDKHIPVMEELNALYLMDTQQLAYGFQEGIAEWDVGTTYYINSIVKKTGTSDLYISKTDSNIGNALTDTTNWALYFSLSSNTAKAFTYSDANKNIVTTAAPTNGQILIGSTGAVPVVASLTGTTNQITVTAGAGSITLSLPQSIATGSNVTFNQLTLGGNTAKAFLYSDASKIVKSTAAPTNGQLLIGSTGNIPAVATLTGTSNQVVVTNGAGTITLSLPQSIATTSNPTFNQLTLNGTLFGSAIECTGLDSSAEVSAATNVSFNSQCYKYQADSVSAPSFAFYNGLTAPTGMYSPSSNVIGFSCNGSKIVSISSTGISANALFLSGNGLVFTYGAASIQWQGTIYINEQTYDYGGEGLSHRWFWGAIGDEMPLELTHSKDGGGNRSFDTYIAAGYTSVIGNIVFRGRAMNPVNVTQTLAYMVSNHPLYSSVISGTKKVLYVQDDGKIGVAS